MPPMPAHMGSDPMEIFAGSPWIVVGVPFAAANRLALVVADVDQFTTTRPGNRWPTTSAPQLSMLRFAEVWHGEDIDWSLKYTTEADSLLLTSYAAGRQVVGYRTLNANLGEE